MTKNSCFWAFFVLFVWLAMQRLIWAYAEIHYVFKKGLSFIHRKRPEIVADVPWRVCAGEPLPIMWAIKDADQFPIELRKIDVALSCDGKIARYNLFRGQRRIADRLIFEMRSINLPHWAMGKARIDVQFSYISNGLLRKVKNDNLPGISHDGFDLYISEDDLPKVDGWYYGDLHYHSDKTDDQVEFGAPLWVAVRMSKAMGLNWFAVTDHSYDLDIPEGEMFGLDPHLRRWTKLIEEVDEINGKEKNFAVILGEEISCGNAGGQNIHLLAYRSRKFIPGRGDGGKRGINFLNEPDLPLKEVLRIIQDSGGYGYAAHPHEGSTFLSRTVINRGHWWDKDLTTNGCRGLQLWNGCSKIGLEISYWHWLRLLLAGHRLYVIAGSDSHGDFNRFRRVEMPFFWVTEKRGSSFGRPRTCVLIPDGVTEENIHDALRNGRSIVTDGPFGMISAEHESGRKSDIGGVLPVGRIKIEAICLSTPEFGHLKRARLIFGDLRRKREVTLSRLRTSAYEERFSSIVNIAKNAYFRLEVISEKGRCLTNPIWVSDEMG